jgi:serine/threonine-protein kinase
VPSRVGTTLPHAIATLKAAGLTALVSHVDSNAPEGQVVGQRPLAGTSLGKGGQVHLNVAVHPLVSVPDVTGIQGLQAVHTLEADHLVASLAYVPSTQPARRVIAQFPLPGTKVKRGTSVRINLSQGNRAGASGPTGPTGSG